MLDLSLVLCDPCQEKNKVVSGVMWCIVCNEIFCPDCTSRHETETQKVTKYHDLVDVNFKVDLQEQLSKQQNCTLHSELQIEYYCPAHDIPCCRACLADKHTACLDVIILDNVCQNASSSLLEEVKREINVIHSSVKHLKDESNKNAAVIKNESKNIGSKIVQVQTTVIDRINEYKNKLLSELQREQRKEERHQEEIKQKCKNIVQNLVFHFKAIHFVEIHGTAKQAFLLAHNLKSVVEKIDKSVSILVKDAVVTSLNFDPTTDLISSIPILGSITKSQRISLVTYIPMKECIVQRTDKSMATSLMASDFTVGSMKCIPKSQNISYTQIKENHAKCTVPTANKPLISFKLMSTFRTSDTVNILGMIVTEDNKILLCNYTDKHEVLVYNDNGRYDSTLTTKHRPFDIALIPGKGQYVVTLPIISSIQYIDTDLTPGRCVKLFRKRLTFGIAADKNNIYVGGYDEIFVLKHNGTAVKALKLADSGSVSYLAVNDNHLYASNFNNKVYCINQNNSVRQSEVLCERRIRKIAVDRQGYIYVGGENSGKVHRFDKDLKQKRIKAKQIGEKFVKEIGAICFNKNCTKLFVASERGKTTAVFSCI